MTLGTRRINSICRTRIALWNHRGDTIQNSDDLESDPLRIQLADGDEALQVRVLSMSRKQIGFVPSIGEFDSSVVRISFDFLDSGDGAIMEIVHQRPSIPEILGTIKGCIIQRPKKINLSARALVAVTERSNERRFWSYMPLFAKTVFIVLVLLLATEAGHSLFAFLNQEHEPDHLVNVHLYNLKSLVTGTRADRSCL